MFGRPAGYKHWGGLKQVNTRLEPQLYQAVMNEARKANLSKAAFARTVFLNWYNSGIKDLQSSAPVQAPIAVIPATAPKRADTGRSETIAVLQGIDQDRDAAKGDGKAFAD